MKSEKWLKTISTLMLIIAAAIWGSSFIFQKNATSQVGPFTFMAGRYFLGSVTMLPIIIFIQHKTSNKNNNKLEKTISLAYIRKLLMLSASCSILNMAGSVMVQIGIMYTTVSKASFLNAIYIIFVPLVGKFFFKKKTSFTVYLGVILATVGLYLLCAEEHMIFKKGDIIILLGTLCYGFHIQLISKLVHEVNGIQLACAEFFFASSYCAILALIFENPTIPQILECMPNFLFAGVLGIGICYALQVTAQKYLDPTVAALLMSLESIFGAAGGIIFLGDILSFEEILGSIFIIIAVIFAQIPTPSLIRKKTY